ncbi:MAG TPA: hypothetical protein PLJ21_00675 [Pseudobdellovibrionaceae bacterium]|nr:hypothetical protein [Pseudobdellovibrionaceae bacterium]
MFNKISVFLIVSISIFWLSAEARLINLNSEGFASYLSYYGGSSALATTPFENEAVSGYTYSDSLALNYGGEFGFLYNRGRAGFRFTIEVIRPNKLENLLVKDSNQLTLYSMTSDITGYSPKLGIELGLVSRPTSRWILLFYGGTATVTIKNDFVLTSDGSAAFSGVSDHSVILRATGTQYGGALTYEFLFNDSTTLFFDMGYRSMLLSQIVYAQSVTTFSGVKAQGDAVMSSTGLAKTLDFSGYLLNFGFRIFMY